MIKQVYRFLSILIIANLIFCPAGKSDVSKDAKKEPVDNQKNVKASPKKKPSNTDSGEYTTLYGVMNLDDLYNSYTQPDINKRYGVMSPGDIQKTYPINTEKKN